MQGIADFESSEGARCRDCGILHEARAHDAGSAGSWINRGRTIQVRQIVQNDKNVCPQRLDDVEPIEAVKKVLSTRPISSDLLNRSRN